MELIQRARVVSMQEHLAGIMAHRESAYRASLPRTVVDARLKRFEPRNAADAAVLARTRDWLTGLMAGKADNLSLVGPPGTGKTWLMSAIGWALLPTEHAATYLRAPSAWAAVKATYDGQGESERALMSRWITAKVLLLDEIGAGNVTEPYRACIAEIICRRTDEGLPTVAASNLALADWPKALDDRAADRMAGGTTIALLGASRRGAA